MNRKQKTLFVKRLKLGILSLLGTTLVTSCSVVQTITPPVAHATIPSVDSSTPKQYKSKQNSGLLLYVRDANHTVIGAIVTSEFIEYAKYLIHTYGKEMAPPIADTSMLPGVSPYKDAYNNDLFFIDTEDFDRLRIMAQWAHERKQ